MQKLCWILAEIGNALVWQVTEPIFSLFRQWEWKSCQSDVVKSISWAPHYIYESQEFLQMKNSAFWWQAMELHLFYLVDQPISSNGKPWKHNTGFDSHHGGEIILQSVLLWFSLITSIASIIAISSVCFSHYTPSVVPRQPFSISGSHLGI